MYARLQCWILKASSKTIVLFSVKIRLGKSWELSTKFQAYLFSEKKKTKKKKKKTKKKKKKNKTKKTKKKKKKKNKQTRKTKQKNKTSSAVLL